MKLLVCTDGSEHSLKAINVACTIAEGCRPDEVCIIHVYRPPNPPNISWEGATEESMEFLRKINEQQVEEAKQILSEARAVFESRNIKANTILEQGHPAERIVKVASEKGFDMIVIGNRGTGDWSKSILGSVSNTVVQEVKDCSVVTVK